jgi:hypothetical protein
MHQQQYNTLIKAQLCQPLITAINTKDRKKEDLRMQVVTVVRPPASPTQTSQEVAQAFQLQHAWTPHITTPLRSSLQLMCCLQLLLLQQATQHLAAQLLRAPQ